MSRLSRKPAAVPLLVKMNFDCCFKNHCRYNKICVKIVEENLRLKNDAKENLRLKGVILKMKTRHCVCCS
jgi:hypothetical protein